MNMPWLSFARFGANLSKYLNIDLPLWIFLLKFRLSIERTVIEYKNFWIGLILWVVKRWIPGRAFMTIYHQFIYPSLLERYTLHPVEECIYYQFYWLFIQADLKDMLYLQFKNVYTMNILIYLSALTADIFYIQWKNVYIDLSWSNICAVVPV